MTKLNYSEIEKKWQEYWEENKINKTDNDFSDNKKKFYILDMFPYPSGEGLHVGHPKGYIATDVYSRMKKMQGYNVLHPMGWDAFGLPAEQYAIANKVNPNIATEKNVKRYKEQIEMLGINYDWDREINTTDPKYYKWTQWMFKQMYKDGLAHESFEPINWCPSCKTGLSNEDLDGNACERCGTIVEKKPLRQWVIKITNYADRLLNDLDKLNWEPHIKELQRNWIGKSEGSEIDFEIVEAEKNNLKENKLKIFTTRADTLFGCTFMCISYTLAKEWISNGWQASDEIKNFIKEIEAEEKTRTVDFDINKLEKKGIDTNIKAINPANGEEVPIYIANYILSDYGTGAIMAVPAHDERDFEFAKKYNLEIREVIRPYVVDKINTPREDKETVVRENVHAIVFDPKENKYLILRNQEHNWDTVVIGGIEKEETPIEAAIREIKEETGYINLKYIKTLGNPVQAGYFAKHKDQNRLAISTCVYFELVDDNRVDISENEGNEILWINKEDFVPGKMVNSELSIWLERLNSSTDILFSEEGVLVNSHSFGNENVKNIVTVGEILPDAKEVYGSSVIAYDKNKNLFLKLNNLNVNETWLASGGINEGESYQDCAARELQEEAGISKIDKLVDLGAPIVAYYFNPNKNSNRKSFGYNYLAFVDSNQEIKSSNEAHEKYSTEWVSFEEIYNSIANIKPESHHWLIALNRAKAFIDNNFDGMKSEEARVKITEKVGGKVVSKYKLKDWVFARQRYWGEPFPIVFDEHRKSFAVADKELPVVLPNVENYEPTDNGESPLANIKDWVEVYGFINSDGEFESLNGVNSERELKTIDTYKKNLKTYQEQTPQVIEGEYKKELDIIIEKLTGKDVLEIGSAFGRDGEYLKTGGVSLKMTDVVKEFGQQELNPLTDFIGENKYDGIISISSLLHLEKENFLKVIKKINFSLKQNGYLYLRMKVGEGIKEEESKGGYRFFSLYSKEKLENILKENGFEIEYFSEQKERDDKFSFLVKKVKNCGIQKFFRETNTMPQWAGSSWYYLRYIDPKNDNEFVNKELEKSWNPVDFYVGGAEHATRHLIYARFWHKFLFDKGFVSYDEPFTKLQTVGLIMAEDGKKMSKRYGNVVNPDDVVREFGADAMRTYEMFMGPFDKAIAWSTNSMAGVSRFLERVYNFSQNDFSDNESKDSKEVERIINQTIKKVGEDIQDFKFNTAISQLMICLNAFEDEIKKGGKVSKNSFANFVKLIAPFAPYISEEIHQNVFRNNSSIHIVAWPKYDEEKIKLDEIEMSLQISGKFRGTFKIKAEANEEEIKEFVKGLEVYKKYVPDESQIKKIIVVQNRLINIVI